MPRGASRKREREFKELEQKFQQSGRYKGREEEVAARIVNKQRRQYGETMIALAESEPDLLVLTADLMYATGMEEFGRRFPERLINVGIAEQNMAGIAAGLALSGRPVIACGYAAFTLMPAEARVLTVEYKLNMLSPAKGDYFRCIGRVVKPGRTITVCDGEVLACKGHTDRVTGICWGLGGKVLVSCGFDHSVRVWDAANGTLVQTLAAHVGPVVRAAVTTDSGAARLVNRDETLGR